MIEVAFRKLMMMATATDVFWSSAPEGTELPAIICHFLNEEVDMTQDGPDTFRKAVIQVDVWSTDLLESNAIGNKVRRLNGYNADLNDISNIIMTDARSETDDSDPDNVVYRRTFDFDVFYHADAIEVLPGEGGYVNLAPVYSRIDQLEDALDTLAAKPVPISQEAGNALSQKSDGLFASGLILSSDKW